MTYWFPLLRSFVGCVALLAVAGCIPPRLTTFRVEGIVDEATFPGPYRAVQPGDIVDAHADRVVPDKYINIVRPSAHREQQDVQASLIQEFSSPSVFRRVIETRRGILALGSQEPYGWLDTDALLHAKRVVVTGHVLREWAIRDLPLVERILNVPGHVDDQYEALRRAVLLDSETLSKQQNATASSARFWLCVRSANVDAVTIELYGVGRPYPANATAAMQGRIEDWLHAHRLQGNVRVLTQSADNTAVIRVDSDLAVRVEMLPLLSRKDGTLLLVSDGATRVDRVYK